MNEMYQCKSEERKTNVHDGVSERKANRKGSEEGGIEEVKNQMLNDE